MLTKQITFISMLLFFSVELFSQKLLICEQEKYKLIQKQKMDKIWL